MTVETPVALLNQLDAAFKSIVEVSTLGTSVLQPEKQAQFVEAMQHKTVILNVARFISMDAQKYDIDRTGFVGRVLRSGALESGEHRDIDSATDTRNPQFNTNQLDAKELVGITAIRDTALRRNIEREAFANHLVDLFGEAAGRDLEEYALLADTDLPYNTDNFLHQTDGWAKLAANKVYGRNSAGQQPRDFDGSDLTGDGDVEAVFEAMLQALPKQFLQDPGDWRYYVTWEVSNEYHNQLKRRGTPLGDTAQTDSFPLRYKGIPIVYVPMLERAAAVDIDTDADVKRDRVEGRIAMLQYPDNMVWGVFETVTVEPERKPRQRLTNYVLTFEGDAHYEDENAAVIAFLDKANPAVETS